LLALDADGGNPAVSEGLVRHMIEHTFAGHDRRNQGPLDGNDPGPARPWSDLREDGLLWLINRTVFHPRGFALAMHFDDAGDALGWSLLGDGSEPWTYKPDGEEDDCFARAESALARVPGATR
jgi:hypothetical protein